MRALVGEWISNLIIIAILAALVDMILPSGNMRKYTGFIFGLVILIMFLQPLFQLFHQAPDLEKMIFQNTIEQSREAAAFVSNQEADREEMLEKVLRENLEKDLALKLEYQAGLDNVKVSIVFDSHNGSADLSNIQRIEVTASLKDQPVFIEPVIIGSEDDSHNGNTGVKDGKKVQEIKQYISGLYDIEQDKIFINGK